MNNVYFGKLRPDAKIPTKRDEDAGYDIYACFDFDEDYTLIPAHATRMIPTGLVSFFSSDYVGILKERGSTGSKGIAQRCGVIDSGYRGEWFVPLTNTTNKAIVIGRDTPEIKRWAKLSEYTFYPYEKAICQCIFVEVPQLMIKEIDADEIINNVSERGQGKLGSSNK
jgi:dUTP pyrophosphatase